MSGSERPPISAHLRGHLDEAERQLQAAESEQPDGALAPAKAVLVQLVRRATWHQRAFDRAVLRALELLLADVQAAADASETAGRRFSGVEEGMGRFDERITQLEKRAARAAAMRASIATDVHALRTALLPRENGAARDGE